MSRVTPFSVPMALLVLGIVQGVAAAAETDTEFAVNLFSDLAPILALFGENFAVQFLSESFSWVDHVIFAMVPLGIVTAVTGAIRVQGFSWLRAFIGRARETRATAEIELMSSTSPEVCELFNGQGIVRAMGKANINQILIFPTQYNQEAVNNHAKHGLIQTLRRLAHEEAPPGFPPADGIHVISTACGYIPSAQSESAKPDPDLGDVKLMRGEVYKSYSYRLFADFLNMLSVKAAEPLPRDVEQGKQHDGPSNADDARSGGHAHKQETDREKTKRVEVKALNNLGPPNLQLNHARPYHGRPHHSDRLWTVVKLVSAAVASVVIQCGLIAIAAVTTYRAPTRQAVGYDFVAYGFPCFCVGSLLLCVGMALCSIAIGQSTDEHCWIREKETQKHDGASTSDPRLIWIQKGQSVNDQVFDPYIILEGARKTIVTSSRHTLDGARKTIVTSSRRRKDHAAGGRAGSHVEEEEGGAEKSIGSDVPCDAEPTPSKNAPASATSAAPLGVKVLQRWQKPWGWLKEAWEWLKEQVWPSLTLAGVIFSGSGFVCQFVGLRALPFPLAFAQLGGVVIMAMIRAAVRSELGYPFLSHEALPDYELEYLAIQITFNSAFRTLKSPLDAKDGTRNLTRKDALSRYCWRVTTAEAREGEDQVAAPKGPNRTMTGSPRDKKLFFKNIEQLVQDQVKKAITPGPGKATAGTSPQTEGQPTNTAPIGVGRRPEPGDAAHDTVWSHQLLRVHWRLRHLCNWVSVGSAAAAALRQSMKFALDEFFPPNAAPPDNTSRLGKGINIAIPATRSSGWHTESPGSAHGTDTYDHVVVRCWVHEGKWDVEEGILESLISLWMSYVEAKDLKESRRSPAAESTRREQTRNTYPYRRILGDDDEYKTLSRDLHWWIDGYPQLLQTGASQPTNEAKVVIGFNGTCRNHPKYGGDDEAGPGVDSGPTTREDRDDAEISIEATQALPLVLAQHIFTCFMWSIVDSLGRECWQRGASSSQRQVQIAWADGLDWDEFKTTWWVPTLQHRLLTTVVGQIERTGLGDKTEILLCMIPPLSRADVLPNEAYLRLLPSPGPNQGWAEQARCYGQLLEKLDVVIRPREEERLCFALVARAIDFLLLASEPFNDCVTAPAELVEELRGIVKLLLTRYSDVLLSLFPVYQLQQRLTALHAALDKYMDEDFFYWVAVLADRHARDRDDASISFIRRVDTSLQLFSKHKELVGKDGVPANLEGQTSSLARLKEAARIMSEGGHWRWKKPKVFTSQETISEGLCNKLNATDDHASVWVAMSCDDEDSEATIDDEASEATDDDYVKGDAAPAALPGPIAQQDIFGWTPLHYASLGSYAKVFKPRLQAFKRKRQGKKDRRLPKLLKDRLGRSPIHVAAQAKSKRALRKLLNETENPAEVIQWGGIDGMTPLHLAIKRQRSGCMRHLLDFYSGKLPKGQSEQDRRRRCKVPSETDIWGRQALHIAIGNNAHEEICKALISSVDTLPDHPDNFNRTPLDYVFVELNLDDEDSRVKVKRQLVLLGAMLDKMNPDSLVTKLSDGNTLAHRAVIENNLEAVKKIYEKVKLLRVKDSQGRSLLHVAAMSAESKEIVQHLVDNGANLNDQDSAGQTPLVTACQYSCVAAADIILAKARDKRIEFTDKELKSALKDACQNGYLGIVELLLEKCAGSIAMERDRDMWTQVLCELGDWTPTKGPMLFYFCTDEESKRSFLDFVLENPAWGDVDVRLPKLFASPFDWTTKATHLDLEQLRRLGSVNAVQGYLKGAIAAFQDSDEQLITLVKHLGHFELAVLARPDMDGLRETLEARLQDRWPDLIKPQLSILDADGWGVASWLTRWQVRPPSPPAWVAELDAKREKIISSSSPFRIPDEYSGSIKCIARSENPGVITCKMSHNGEEGSVSLRTSHPFLPNAQTLKLTIHIRSCSGDIAIGFCGERMESDTWLPPRLGGFYGSWGYDRDGDIRCNDMKPGYLTALPIDTKDSASRLGSQEGRRLVDGTKLEISLTQGGESIKCFRNGKGFRAEGDEKGGAGWSGYFKFGKVYPCVLLGVGCKAEFNMTMESVPETM